MTTGKDDRALCDGLLYDALDLSRLRVIDQRAEMHLTCHRVTAHQGFGTFGQFLRVLIGQRTVHQMSSGLHADLALMQESAPSRAATDRVDVGIIQHDHGVVAAELQCAAFQLRAATLANLATDRG